MDLPAPLEPDHGDRLSRRHLEAHVEQDLALGVVAEIDIPERDRGAARGIERPGPGLVLDLAVFPQQVEHLFHVGERLLDLAVHDAEKVERNVELDQQCVDHHQIADGHGAPDDALRRAT